MGAETRPSSLGAPETAVALVKAAAAAVLAQRWGPSLCGNPVWPSGTPRSGVVSLLAPAIQPLGRNVQERSSPFGRWRGSSSSVTTVPKATRTKQQPGHHKVAALTVSANACPKPCVSSPQSASHSCQEGKVAGTASRDRPPPTPAQPLRSSCGRKHPQPVAATPPLFSFSAFS